MAVEDSNGRTNKAVLLYTAGDVEYSADDRKYQYSVVKDGCKVWRGSARPMGVGLWANYMYIQAWDFEAEMGVWPNLSYKHALIAMVNLCEVHLWYKDMTDWT